MLRSKRYRFVLTFRESFNGYLRCNDVFFGLSGHNLPLFPLYPVPEHRPFAAPAAVCAVLVAGCVPLLVSYRLENVFSVLFYPFYRYGLYFIFIGCIILFTVTLIADALFWLLSFTPLLTKFSFCCRWLNWGILALSLLFAAGALYAGVKVPVVKNVDISSEKLTREYTVVVLSDLHIHRVISPQKIERIVSLANARNPDVVLLAGDIIDDDVRRVSKITALLKGLKASKGIYFVTGNHEFYAGYDEAVRELANLGFMFLENDGAAVGKDLYLAGVPDLSAGAAMAKRPT